MRLPVPSGVSLATALLAALVGSGLGACTASDPSPPSPPASSAAATAGASGTDPCPEVDASVVRGSRAYDYETYPSITADADASAERGGLSVVGRVERWEDGPAWESGGALVRHAVLTVAVEQVRGATTSPPSRVQVLVYRGVQSEPDDPGSGNVTALEDLVEAVPPGVRIIALGAIRPRGAEVFEAGPNSLLVESGSCGSDSLTTFPADIAHWTAHAADLAGDDAAAPHDPGSFQNLVDELLGVT